MERKRLLVSKSLDTDLARSEKQTLYRIAMLYLLLSIIIIFGFSFMYYKAQKELMLQEKKAELQQDSQDFLLKLKQLHINFDKTQEYPRSSAYESAIFDSDKKLIFATIPTQLSLNKILYLQDAMVHLVSIPESYYLGAKYVIIQIKDNALWYETTKKELLLFNLLAFSVMFVIGYVLLRLFLKPMRDAIHLLDRFIKDTTHELNTPVSTIVNNIEMIDTSLLDAKTLKKINRIDIGAKTISNIYQDLTYLTLGNKIVVNDEKIELGALLQERVDYFKSLANAKKVFMDVKIVTNASLVIDRAKLSKLVDNLLSNAIKYNKINGYIHITLHKNEMIFEDGGIGIAQENIANMQERYTRFNNVSGGFGLGLSIVSSIAQEYNLKIKIESEEFAWTRVSLQW